jgi:hypothetical protein
MSPNMKEILIGTSHTLDIGARLRPTLVYPINLSDEDAIRQDWIAVGNDIRHAMTHYGDEDVKQKSR